MALTKIKAGSIADGAVTSAKLAAGAGGVKKVWCERWWTGQRGTWGIYDKKAMQ